MSGDVTLLVIGWLLGLLSSLATSIVSYWLEGRRSIRDDIRRQRREDIRIARDWMYQEKKASLRGFNLKGANLSGKDLSGADLEQADLEGAQLWGTKFVGTNLREA